MSSTGFGAQLLERLKGVAAIACIVTAGFLTYPPLLAFGIVACAADEFYRIARQQRLNMRTYAQESDAPAVGMASRIVVGPVTHKVARLHQGKRAAYVALCVASVICALSAGISAASLVSYEAMTFTALLFSFLLLVWLMATEVERRDASSATSAAADADAKAISGSSSAASSAAASVDSSPPPPSLLLHPSSALLSAQEFCSVLVLIVGLWYAGWMFSHGVLVLRHPSGIVAASSSAASAASATVSLGVSRIVYVIFVTAGGENGGLFFGKLWGRRKLCRRISPGKTVEGAIGQLVTSIVVSVAFRCWVSIDIPLLDSILLGLALGVVGCVGDLFESFLKRSIGVKDAGRIIPGAGGMLDRMDGLIFNFPVMLAYLQVMHPIASGAAR